MISKKLKKNIYIIGLGISGMSLARALKKTLCHTICWDDDILTRKKAKKNKIKVIAVENVNFKTLDYLVLSPGIKSEGKIHILLQQRQKKIKLQ